MAYGLWLTSASSVLPDAKHLKHNFEPPLLSAPSSPPRAPFDHQSHHGQHQTQLLWKCLAASQTTTDTREEEISRSLHSLLFAEVPAPRSNDAEPTITFSFQLRSNLAVARDLHAHQAATQRPINPEGDIKNLERLGTSGFILTLLEDAESTLPLPSKSTLTPQQRVERIQTSYGLKECPQNERPKPTTSKALIEPQSYNQPSTGYTNPGLDELSIDALFFTLRTFGHLFRKFPLGMGDEEPSQSSLISLYLEAIYLWEFGSLVHTYASGPGQASTPRQKSYPPQLAELNSDPPKDVSYRL
ncbi:hypothetical protein NCS56_01547700 [Fusarium sp. Ph1]|nr:hypothetical protein NCS56_01547700 [Fusarium sp. Ph1]